MGLVPHRTHRRQQIAGRLLPRTGREVVSPSTGVIPALPVLSKAEGEPVSGHSDCPFVISAKAGIQMKMVVESQRLILLEVLMSYEENHIILVLPHSCSFQGENAPLWSRNLRFQAVSYPQETA